jgi:hypothetical protein
VNNEKRRAHEAVADAKDRLLDALRICQSLPRASTFARKLDKLTARAEALQIEMRIKWEKSK